MNAFNYNEFTKRNLGFVTEEQQQQLKKAVIFIPGVGGMGGTALECLVRSGVENFIISDFDTFEVSNLNRQIFSQLSKVGQNKAEVAKQKILDINPQARVEIYGADWTEKLDEILPQVTLAINGCDDAFATAILMRSARKHNKTVVDAFASTLPNVYVVRPEDPRPEELFQSPLCNQPENTWREEWRGECTARELQYVLAASSSMKYVVMKYAQEMIAGQRSRISMAPMVWGTGILMSYEAIKIILSEKSVVTYRGVFMNPYTCEFEKPPMTLILKIKMYFVEKFFKQLRKG